jgi:hypothetical protein
VVDQLRLYLHRPLRERDRLRLFAIAVAVIVAGVVGLALLDDAGPSQQPRDDTPRPRPIASPVSTPGLTMNSVETPHVAPSEEGLPTAVTRTTAATIREAKRAARGFLTGYLAYSYGQAPAASIDGAASALERELADQPPRVPARERARYPRVKLIQTNGVSRHAASLLAVVDDGARSYTLTLELERRADDWLVIEVRS